MFSRKVIDYSFIEQPLWFSRIHGSQLRQLLESLRVASRANGKRLRAEMLIRLLMYTYTRTTQSNFLSLLISVSLSLFFFFMNVKPLMCKRPRTNEKRDKQREKAVTWSPLALVDCRKRHPKSGCPLLRIIYAYK